MINYAMSITLPHHRADISVPRGKVMGSQVLNPSCEPLRCFLK
jgi:hypothetical protein